MFVIGLTGGVATGKSIAAQYFKRLGAKVFDADKTVHDLLKNDTHCIRQIKKDFGPAVIRNKSVDRSELGAVVFKSTRALKKLEGIVHPLVRQRCHQFLKTQAKSKWVVLDIPLLFETGYWKNADINVVVKANQALQIQRIIHRSGVSRAEALRRIRAQMPMAKKISLADEIIDNRGSKKQLEKQVKAIYLKYISKK